MIPNDNLGLCYYRLIYYSFIMIVFTINVITFYITFYVLHIISNKFKYKF